MSYNNNAIIIKHVVTISEQKKEDVRKQISIELCENLIYRLHPAQKKETKIGALIALKNLIKETKINDPLIYNPLIDATRDPDNEIKTLATKIIEEIKNKEINELLLELQDVG